MSPSRTSRQPAGGPFGSGSTLQVTDWQRPPYSNTGNPIDRSPEGGCAASISMSTGHGPPRAAARTTIIHPSAFMRIAGKQDRPSVVRTMRTDRVSWRRCTRSSSACTSRRHRSTARVSDRSADAQPATRSTSSVKASSPASSRASDSGSWPFAAPPTSACWMRRGTTRTNRPARGAACAAYASVSGS